MKFAACLLLAALCQGCATPEPLFPPPAVAATAFRFNDGGSAIQYTIDKQLAPGAIATWLFVVGGSGCADMRPLLPHYFRGLEGESGPIRIFILQKRFTQPQAGRGCSDAFVAADHPQRWLADQAEFIEAQLRQGAPPRIALLGISEGGEVVPALARRIAGVTHLAILSNGGMDPIDAYRLQARRHGFTPAEDGAGRSARYWAELRQVRQTDNLLALSIPILVGMGEADSLVPIESAWHIRDTFAAHRKRNLTLLTWPGADHALYEAGAGPGNGAGRNHVPDFLFTLDKLLQE